MHPRHVDDTVEDAAWVEAIAEQAFAVLGTGRQVTPFSARYPGFDLDRAYRVTAAVRALREAAGERPLGRKIGFTNRTIWAEYDVHQPIWGHVYDRTVHALETGGRPTTFSLAGLSEPRIEPEIMFGLLATPEPDMTEAQLLDCIDWVAHGFEIVQSIFPAWRFSPADTVAAFGLHGALLVGPRQIVSAGSEDWRSTLASLQIALARNGEVVDRGAARNVLDGPLSALRHLVGLLSADRTNTPLAAGEIITTGTLTRAFPVAPGEAWSTELAGTSLKAASILFAA